MSMTQTSTTRPDRGATTPLVGIAQGFLIVAAGVAAYLTSFAGVFMFDDRAHILGDLRIDHLWPLWDALARKRPVVDYSFALNRAFFGQAPWGYHAFNLTVHLLASLTLFGIVRRTLLMPAFRGRQTRSASWSAVAVALLWTLHPLQTQSVTYLVQRAESMMGLFYLLTLYCVIRGGTSSRRSGWFVGAVVACALGMGSKGVAVTAPAMVLLHDRVFLARSWAELLRRRWVLYVALASTGLILVMNGLVPGILNTQNRAAHVGFGFKGVTPLAYAGTQLGVLVEYLKLSLWPAPLCLDYSWPIARTAGDVLVPGLVVAVAAGATLWALIRRAPWGFWGAWFFLILAPTSSIVPIKDTLFEHRMYLPLAGLIVLLVLGVQHVLASVARRMSLSGRGATYLASAVLSVAAVLLGAATSSRNALYASEAAMWADVRHKRPNSVRAAKNYGTALLAEGRLTEAMEALQEAVRVAPESPDIRNGLGLALAAHGRMDESIAMFREAIRLRPAHVRALVNLGNALYGKGNLVEAAALCRRALQLHPENTGARLTLGNVFLRGGQSENAVAEYRLIVEIDPLHAAAWRNLGTALLSLGRMEEGVEAAGRAVESDPTSAKSHNSLGIALAAQGKLDESAGAFRRALEIDPTDAVTHYNLGKCLLSGRKLEEAVAAYTQAVTLQPAHFDAHYELGVALSLQGNVAEAIEHYEKTLRLRPDHPEALRALAAARAKASSGDR